MPEAKDARRTRERVVDTQIRMIMVMVLFSNVHNILTMVMLERCLHWWTQQVTEEDSTGDHLYVKTETRARPPDCMCTVHAQDRLKMQHYPLLCARCTCSIHKDESKHPFLPDIYSAKLSGDDTLHLHLLGYHHNN